MTTDEFMLRLADGAARTEAMLEALLSERRLPGEIARPEKLLAAMRYASLGGGKRARPFLLIECARVFGAEGVGPVRAGAALELLHCYSLAHDDLPAMDDDDERRGKPSLHRAFDEATAILAGDALLTLAFDVLADPETDPDAGVRAELVLMLARASGIGGMAGGQQYDLDPSVRDEAAVRRMQAMKTGALFRFACEAGAVIGRAVDADRVRLRDFGSRLGAAFQLADDLADNDAPLGVERSRALLAEETRAAGALIAPLGARGEVLAAAVAFLGSAP